MIVRLAVVAFVMWWIASGGLGSAVQGAQGALAGSSAPQPTSGDSPANVRAIACDAALAGWPEQDIPTAVAITFPESAGNPQAVQQDEPPELTGYGLWQITPGNAALLDPLANAKAALGKFDSQGWNAWTTYRDGLDEQYLPTVDADLSGFDYSTC